MKRKETRKGSKTSTYVKHQEHLHINPNPRLAQELSSYFLEILTQTLTHGFLQAWM
jgi:hypothetical protein